MALAWQENEGSTGTPWFALFFWPLITVIVALCVRAHRKKRNRIETWTTGLGFKPLVSLPPGLRAPKNAWRAAPSTRRILIGQYRGFRCVMFEVDQGVNDSQKWMSAVSVERSPVGTALAMAMENLGAEVDQNSTPGWIIGLISGANAEQPAMEPLLKLLTRETWSEITDYN